MHNLERNKKPIDNAFKETRKSLHKEKADFLDRYEDQYKANCKDYDDKAAAGNLNDLIPQWGKSEDPRSEYMLSFNLYSSSRPVITEHNKALTKGNGDKIIDDEELLCPICSLRPVEETDHFSPRSIFPEYSCHLSNLIPLCHSCNSGKSDDWLDDSGKQIFFNAYYDIVSFDNLFEVNVTFDVANKTMLAHLQLISTLDPDNNPIHFRVKETTKRLGLIKEYRSRASMILRSLTNQLKSAYKVTGSMYDSEKSFIDKQVSIWNDQLMSGGFVLPIERLLYSHLIQNTNLQSELIHLFI